MLDQLNIMHFKNKHFVCHMPFVFGLWYFRLSASHTDKTDDDRIHTTLDNNFQRKLHVWRIWQIHLAS